MVDPKGISDRLGFLRLWVHECARVFRDRLVDDTDRNWFNAQIDQRLKSSFNLGYADLGAAPRLIFGDFMVPGADPRLYVEITDMTALKAVCSRRSLFALVLTMMYQQDAR